MDKTMSELFIGAFFFAMRSCKYLFISGPRKTKLLALQNIRFYQVKSLLLHNNNLLHLADTVSITFEVQKKNFKVTIAHYRLSD